MESANTKQQEDYPIFSGYPYLVIRIMNALYHINLLSEQNSREELLRLAQAQADANKFDVCIVLAGDKAVYVSTKHEPHFSGEVPGTSTYTTGRLRLQAEPPVTPDLWRRTGDLEVFIQRTTKTGFLLGDLTKGGRKATPEERIRLQGVQENGLPKGLEVCPTCGESRGACLDPNPLLKGVVVKVSCNCENDNLCARCGGKLNDRKLNANRYDPEDGKIWHTPGFSGLNHRCPKSLSTRQ